VLPISWLHVVHVSHFRLQLQPHSLNIALPFGAVALVIHLDPTVMPVC
jgi:hypothetical protein